VTTARKQTGEAKALPLLRADTRLRIASWVLIAAGFLDLTRGFAHTFNIRHAAANIAQVDMASPMIGDFLVVMSAFGMSNYLTGLFAIVVGFKARELAPLFLGIIPVTYALGTLSMRINAIEGTAAFSGRYMMVVYLAICVLIALYYYIPSWLGLDGARAGAESR